MADLVISLSRTELTRLPENHGAPREKVVRCYRFSPESTALQIRGVSNKTTWYAHATLSAEECRTLAAKLVECAAEIEAKR